MGKRELLDKAEEIAETVLRQSKHLLPHLARLFLISTFLEDGIRMWVQWSEQTDYFHRAWNIQWILAALFVFYNMLAQIGSSIAILLRLKVVPACGVLFSIVLLQTIAYQTLLEYQLLVRSISLIGALLLLLAESHVESKSLFAGVPTLGDNKPKKFLQLTGRILVVLMFVSILRFDASVTQLLIGIGTSFLMVLVTIGYKTKLSALVLVIWLTLLNVYMNPWWKFETTDNIHDFLRYDFFQILSVIGGLLMVVSLGPGGVSMDEHKKQW